MILTYLLKNFWFSHLSMNKPMHPSSIFRVQQNLDSISPFQPNLLPKTPTSQTAGQISLNLPPFLLVNIPSRPLTTISSSSGTHLLDSSHVSFYSHNRFSLYQSNWSLLTLLHYHYHILYFLIFLIHGTVSKT